MLHFPRWQVILVVAICALGVVFSVPNLFSPATVQSWPGWLPKKQVALGLDLRGGSHLLLEVDFNSVIKERMQGVVDSMRTKLREARIGYTGLNAEGDKVVFNVREQDRLNDIRQLVRDVDPDLEPVVGSDGLVTLRFSERAIEARRRAAVEQSIEIVRRRIDETGTKEPTIQRQGEDRILVQLPGIDNPEHVKSLIGKTAKLTFQLVDTSLTPE